jgi:hypothetical protein
MHLYTSVEIEEGDGARVNRLFPTPLLDPQDPFVLLDEFFLDRSAGFPDHPHAGFEALTYMLTGAFRHKDNLGNNSEILAGGAQWFMAGEGITHSEMPGPFDINHGLQLWINLPRRLKRGEPRYGQAQAAELPIESIPGGKRKRVVGKGSPVLLHTPVEFLDMQLGKGSSYLHEVPENHRGFVYMIDGSITVEGSGIEPRHAYLFDIQKKISMTASANSRFIVVSGLPLGEPIRISGSFVE